jgi:hypothetical protein
VFSPQQTWNSLGKTPMEKTLLLCLIVSTILLLANLSPAVRPVRVRVIAKDRNV